jgi:hypothetical protein
MKQIYDTYVGTFVHWHTCCRTVSTPKNVRGCNAGIIVGGPKCSYKRDV